MTTKPGISCKPERPSASGRASLWLSAASLNVVDIHLVPAAAGAQGLVAAACIRVDHPAADVVAGLQPERLVAGALRTVEENNDLDITRSSPLPGTE
jgi:hypothetical protein